MSFSPRRFRQTFEGSANNREDAYRANNIGVALLALPVAWLAHRGAPSWRFIALACALVKRPDLLVLYDPLGPLDLKEQTEIRDRLQRYGYVGETIEGVVLRLQELGYLDDAEFARLKTREKARRYGPRRVSVELKKSGVGETLAREVVEEEFAGRSEVEEARSAAARRYNGRGSDAEARRVYGFLVRRGYSAEVCAQVAREYREPPEA